MTFSDGLDQAPITLKHFLLGLLPEMLRPWASMLISISAIITVFAGLFALITWMERKGLDEFKTGSARIASARGACSSRSPTA